MADDIKWDATSTRLIELTVEYDGKEYYRAQAKTAGLPPESGFTSEWCSSRDPKAAEAYALAYVVRWLGGIK